MSFAKNKPGINDFKHPYDLRYPAVRFMKSRNNNPSHEVNKTLQHTFGEPNKLTNHNSTRKNNKIHKKVNDFFTMLEQRKMQTTRKRLNQSRQKTQLKIQRKQQKQKNKEENNKHKYKNQKNSTQRSTNHKYEHELNREKHNRNTTKKYQQNKQAQKKTAVYKNNAIINKLKAPKWHYRFSYNAAAHLKKTNLKETALNQNTKSNTSLINQQLIVDMDTNQSFESDQQLQYQQIQLLANSQILLADFKKFYPETNVQQNQTSLLIHNSQAIYTFAIAYLHYIIIKSKQQRIQNLKKQIIQSNFDNQFENNQQMKELIVYPIEFKRIVLKILRQMVQQKSVYHLILYYDIDMLLTFLFKCLLRNSSNSEQLNNTNIPQIFAKCFSFDMKNQETFVDKSGQRLIIKLKNQEQIDIVEIL